MTQNTSRLVGKPPKCLLRCLLAGLGATTLAFTQTLASPSLEGFRDGIHHWQNFHHTKDYPRLSPDDVRGIAENILLYQRDNGGWRENEDPLRILSEAEKAEILAARQHQDTSLDNDNVWPHICYLAEAYKLTHDERFREACLRGLAFVLGARHPSGMWPHSFPRQDAYYPQLTVADAVTPHLASMLRKIGQGKAPFDWIPEASKTRAAEAAAQARDALVKLQVRIQGVLTGWAGQYDRKTLQPCQGRAFELPSVVCRESIDVLRFLMEEEHPSPETIAAIEAGIAWLYAARLPDLRLDQFSIPPVVYTYHTATYDVRLVEDKGGPGLWARFYALDDGSPLLATREGKRVPTLQDIPHERRSGYGWYGTWPANFLKTEVPAWRKRVGIEESGVRRQESELRTE